MPWTIFAVRLDKTSNLDLLSIYQILLKETALGTKVNAQLESDSSYVKAVEELVLFDHRHLKYT